VYQQVEIRLKAQQFVILSASDKDARRISAQANSDNVHVEENR